MANENKNNSGPKEPVLLTETGGELLRKGGLNLRPVTPPPPDPPAFRPQDSGSSQAQQGGDSQEPKK